MVDQSDFLVELDIEPELILSEWCFKFDNLSLSGSQANRNLIK